MEDTFLRDGCTEILESDVVSLVWESLVAQMVNNLPAIQEAWVCYLAQVDPLKKGMATQSHILAWKTPWTKESGRLQSMGSQRVRHNWQFYVHFPCALLVRLYIVTIIIENSMEGSQKIKDRASIWSGQSFWVCIWKKWSHCLEDMCVC